MINNLNQTNKNMATNSSHYDILDPVDVHASIQAAHHAAYSAVALFGEHHRFKDGSRFCDPEPMVGTGITLTHGVFSNTLDFIPLSTILVGRKLSTRCKCAMSQVDVGGIEQLVRQHFAKNKDWRIGDVRVSVKEFLKPILKFLENNSETMEAFAGVYENDLAYTDVLGLVITSKNEATAGQRMTWEITIDNADLVPPLSLKGLFCR